MRKDLNNIGKIYGDMLKAVKTVQINEATLSKKNQKMGTKKGPGDEALPGYNQKGEKNTTKVGNEDTTGPENVDGVTETEIDANKLKKDKNNNFDKEVGGDVEKTVKEAINTFMTKKSIFDKLYTEMMGEGPDTHAAGADSHDELHELGIEHEGEPGDVEAGGDTVTLTLDKDLAQKLHDVLMSVLGGEHEASESEDVEAAEHEGEDEDEESFEEDEEVLGTPVKDKAKVDMGEKGKNKVDLALKVGPGKGGDSKVTDKVGNDGDHGHALHGAKVPKPGMKVDSKITSKTGEYMFAQK